MNADELQGCLRMLRAYWPSDWDEARQTVWIDALVDLPPEVATAALRELGRSSTYPTVAEFLTLAGVTHDGEVQVVGDAMFVPGTGWLGGKAPAADRPLALESPAGRDEALAVLRAARAQFEIAAGEGA
jgi:hypothetical protein